MYVRKDSDIYSLEDMRGKSIAWSDPNTTSGYLVPSYELHQRGINPSTFFSRTGFAGGHEQAIIAEKAGACAVMALERIPSDIRKDGGISRMSDPEMIKEIQKSVSIPVMAKCRIGHFAEAQVLEALEIDFIDESEVLTPADEHNHVWKHDFKVPFVCGCRNLGEALRRIAEGAALIRTKGEAGSGNIVEAVRHMRTVVNDIKRLTTLKHDQLVSESKNMGAPLDLVILVSETGKLPVPNFAAGGIATPADASLMMQLGAETVFVGSGIFKSEEPISSARAVVEATTLL
jgi:pyridoxal 5'-phosphate synthase pdxS subunit